MERIAYQNLLYDFYGELLTDHQRRIYECAVYEDLSLKELSDEDGITRQGIHDLIKRCDKTLAEYENRLHMIEKSSTIKEIVDQIKEASAEDGSENGDRIRGLCERLLETL